jgi:hypothetical protein
MDSHSKMWFFWKKKPKEPDEPTLFFETRSVCSTQRSSELLCTSGNFNGSPTPSSGLDTVLLRRFSFKPLILDRKSGIQDFSKIGTTVRQILYDPIVGPQFVEYAMKRHCAENVMFLSDVINGRLTATQLMDMYFSDKSVFEINLASATKAEIEHKFATNAYSSINNLFALAIGEVFADVKQSDLFRGFCASNASAKIMMEDADTLLLIEWIQHRTLKEALKCFEKVDHSMIKFCCIVHELQHTFSSTARKTLALKIVARFIQKGSPFEITLPQIYMDVFIGGTGFHIDDLYDARIYCLHQLAAKGPCMEKCRAAINLFM